MRVFLHRNHKRALQNKEFDKEGYNDGWTVFWNLDKKNRKRKCGPCVSTLIEKVELSLKNKEKADISIIKNCYKVIFTTANEYPINYLINGMFEGYRQKYGHLEVRGKLGGYGKDSSRHIIFYESSKVNALKKMEQLLDIVYERKLKGVISDQKACGFISDHVNIDETLKSEVKNPEEFLQKLKRLEKIYCKRKEVKKP